MQARIKKQKTKAPPAEIAVSTDIPLAPPASSSRIFISAAASFSIFSASKNYSKLYQT
jgi:hypothetical protein